VYFTESIVLPTERMVLFFISRPLLFAWLNWNSSAKIFTKYCTSTKLECIDLTSWKVRILYVFWLISCTGAPHVVTIPIQSASPMKVSTLKGSEPTLLPKTIHLASNPMVSVVDCFIFIHPVVQAILLHWTLIVSVYFYHVLYLN
jgi:hypothetical protein